MTGRHLTEADRELLRRVVASVREIEPRAEVILFGSRARGDAALDSDWDFLVLLDGEVDFRRDQRVINHLYPLELELDAVMTFIVHSREQWESSRYRAMPFHEHVDREGITL